ncbi:hypothetical protein P4S63_25380 [Pseudoalteromonas sp. B193]
MNTIYAENNVHASKALSKPSLREVSVDEYESKKHTLDPSVAKRVEHIVYENVRTLEAMQAFTDNDYS